MPVASIVTDAIRTLPQPTEIDLHDFLDNTIMLIKPRRLNWQPHSNRSMSDVIKPLFKFKATLMGELI